MQPETKTLKFMSSDLEITPPPDHVLLLLNMPNHVHSLSLSLSLSLSFLVFSLTLFTKSKGRKGKDPIIRQSWHHGQVDRPFESTQIYVGTYVYSIYYTQYLFMHISCTQLDSEGKLYCTIYMNFLALSLLIPNIIIVLLLFHIFIIQYSTKSL